MNIDNLWRDCFDINPQWKKEQNKDQKEFKNWHSSAVVHGFLPTFPTSLLPTLLFSDSDTSVYIRTSLLPSSLDPGRSHYYVSALVAAMGRIHMSEADACSVHSASLWTAPYLKPSFFYLLLFTHAGTALTCLQSPVSSGKWNTRFQGNLTWPSSWQRQTE